MYYRRHVLNDELVEKAKRPFASIVEEAREAVAPEEGDIVDLLKQYSNDFLFGNVAKRALERIESLQTRIDGLMK